MIFLLGDDSVLDVYDSPEAVWHDIEGLDAEDGVLAMCDERGRRCVVEWIRPNRYGRLLWLIDWGESGVYRVRPEGAPDPGAVRTMIERAVGLGRPGPFASLAEVRAFFAERAAAT